MRTPIRKNEPENSSKDYSINENESEKIEKNNKREAL